MALHNPYQTLFRERILAIGGAGMGKSYNYYAIARMAKNTGSDSIFYVVDTDESVGRMLIDPGFKDALLSNGAPTNVVAYSAYDWETLMGNLDAVYKAMRPQDWLMIDMITPSWDWAQAYFANRVFSKGLDEFFLEHRINIERQKVASKKDEAALDGWKDWSVINDIYDRLQHRLMRCPGNLYATAEVKPLNRQNASKEDLLVFGPHGVMPVGQKHTPHKFSTILWNTSKQPGQFQITTIKDRSRPVLQSQPVMDFAIDYLVNVAAWQLVEAAA